MKRRCVIGIDFGTLSARAVLVDGATGRELAASVCPYPSGVIEHALPGRNTPLKPRTALQDPSDYLSALEKCVPAVLRKGNVSANQIAALGTDFTSCTVLPVRTDGTPLCFDERLASNPHAWPKLWKHHAAQPEADAINAVGERRNEPFLAAYGGRYSSEWFFSKVLETLREAPKIYHAAGFFIEACDWIVWQLCGRQTRNVSAAGFKGMRVYREGEDWKYPPADFFRELHPGLKSVIAEKIGGTVVQLGRAAGELTPAMAKRLKLAAGIPVCAGNIDAHAGVPACGVTEPGSMVMIMGTSTCHLLIGETRQEVEGICGVVEDGIVPGAWGYEAGQAGVGDLFAWHIQHAPAEVIRAAAKRRLSAHDWLNREAGALKPGGSGLLALDWWNGNRSVLGNADLSGLLVGLTLHTTPVQIHRALMEATAFGTRVIIEAFRGKGLAVKKLVAAGGLAQKNPELMQIYADVLQEPIAVAATVESSALGAAIWAATAGGLHKNVQTAARKMARPPKKTYRPTRRHRGPYDRLFGEYVRLHDSFGRGAMSTMKTLRGIQHAK